MTVDRVATITVIDTETKDGKAVDSQSATQYVDLGAVLSQCQFAQHHRSRPGVSLYRSENLSCGARCPPLAHHECQSLQFLHVGDACADILYPRIRPDVSYTITSGLGACLRRTMWQSSEFMNPAKATASRVIRLLVHRQDRGQGAKDISR